MNTSSRESRLLPVISLLITASMWGFVWYPLRLLEQQGLAGAWSALVSYGAALIVCAWIFVRDRHSVHGNILPLAAMSLGAGWCNVAFIIAVLDGNVVRVLLLFYLSPFWAVVLGWFMLGEKPDSKSMSVFFIAVTGAMIMLWNEEIGLPWPQDGADWLAVSSGFAFALSNVYVRRMQDVGVWLKSASCWIGVVLVAVSWILLQGTGIPAVDAGTYAWAVMLGLCGFLVMTVLVQYGVTRMPLHRSAVILLFELVVGAVSSLLLTDEVILVQEWVGGVMIITAAYIAARIHAGDEI